MQPKIVVVMGPDALGVRQRAGRPARARRSQPRSGELQRLTPTIEALYVPNIDEALDEEGAKRDLLARVPGARASGRRTCRRTEHRRLALGVRSAHEPRGATSSDQIGDRCEECGAKLTDGRAGGSARVRRPRPVLDPRGRGRARARGRRGRRSATSRDSRAPAARQLDIARTTLPSLPPAAKRS